MTEVSPSLGSCTETDAVAMPTEAAMPALVAKAKKRQLGCVTCCSRQLSRRERVALCIGVCCAAVVIGICAVLVLIYVVLVNKKITLSRINLSDELAICNDGSPGAFFYHQGADDATWIMHLEGGHWCWDLTSCADRWNSHRDLMSSKNWVYEFDLEGLYSSDVGRLENAHVAFVGYCTSDAHMGNRSASSETYGWHFRGQEIIAATLRELVRRGLGQGRRHLLLFAGCSAGSRGAMVNLDFVGDILSKAGADVEVRGILDAPLWIDMEPYSPDVISLMTQTRGVFNLVDARNRVPGDCSAAYPGDDEWKCIFGLYRLPFLRTPHVMSFHQFDDWQLMWNLGGVSPQAWRGDYLVYVERWRQMVLSFVDHSPVPTGSFYFSSACLVHCTTVSDEIYQTHVPTSEDDVEFGGDRVTLVDTVVAWLDGWMPPRGRLVDHCTGVDCGCDKEFMDVCTPAANLYSRAFILIWMSVALIQS